MNNSGPHYDVSSEQTGKSLLFAFWAGLPESRYAALAEDDTLEAALHEIMAAARTHAPQLATDDFIRFIGRNLSSQVTTGKELGKLLIADLLLVYGYCQEDPAAIVVIEQQYLPQIERSIRHFGLSMLDLEEVRQVLRLRLLASKNAQQGIAPYSGRGELIGWLRVTAIREARHMKKNQQKLDNFSEKLGLEASQVAANAELQLFKYQYREEFHNAFNEAMASLSSKERNLLRYTYLDNLNIDQIALIYKVHRATIARWIIQARDSLLKQTKRNFLLCRQLVGINIDELVQLIWSQLDISIQRHLIICPE